MNRGKSMALNLNFYTKWLSYLNSLNLSFLPLRLGLLQSAKKKKKVSTIKQAFSKCQFPSTKKWRQDSVSHKLFIKHPSSFFQNPKPSIFFKLSLQQQNVQNQALVSGCETSCCICKISHLLSLYLHLVSKLKPEGH